MSKFLGKTDITDFLQNSPTESSIKLTNIKILDKNFNNNMNTSNTMIGGDVTNDANNLLAMLTSDSENISNTTSTFKLENKLSKLLKQNNKQNNKQNGGASTILKLGLAGASALLAYNLVTATESEFNPSNIINNIPVAQPVVQPSAIQQPVDDSVFLRSDTSKSPTNSNFYPNQYSATSSVMPQQYQPPSPVQQYQPPSPVQQYQPPSPVQQYQPPVPVQQYQPPVPVQQYQSPVPVQQYQSPVPVQQYQRPAPFQQPAPVQPKGNDSVFLRSDTSNSSNSYPSQYSATSSAMPQQQAFQPTRQSQQGGANVWIEFLKFVQDTLKIKYPQAMKLAKVVKDHDKFKGKDIDYKELKKYVVENKEKLLKELQ